jgi:Sporulation and spore germination
MTLRAKLVTLVVMAVVAVAILYLHILKQRMAIQSTQRSEAGARARLKEAALQPQAGPTTTVTLYFPSTDRGALIEETRQMTLAASNQDRIRQVLLALMEGSQQGQSRPLPPSTDVRGVFLTPDGTAYLDLASSALNVFQPGIESETLAVYSIVDSICADVPVVKRVKFLIQGQEVDTLEGHVDLTSAFVPSQALGQPGP